MLSTQPRTSWMGWSCKEVSLCGTPVVEPWLGLPSQCVVTVLRGLRECKPDTVDTLALWDDMQKLQEEKQLEPTPIWHELADHWLPTQVSAAEIERVFSLCGHVLTARRNRLHQDNVNLLMTACYGLRQAALDKATEGLHQDMYQAMLEALGQVDVSAEEEM